MEATSAIGKEYQTASNPNVTASIQAEGLEDRAKDNTEPCKDVADADGAQSLAADGKQILRCIEEAQQHLRNQVKGQDSTDHHYAGCYTAQTDGVSDSLFAPGAVVESHDRHHAVV